MDRKTDDKICEIIEVFHSNIAKLLKMANVKLKGNIEIDRLKRLIRIARDEAPFSIITKCKDKIWSSRDQIIKNDEKFFLNKQYDEYIKEDENKDFIHTLIKLFKSGFEQTNNKEKKIMWDVINKLLKNVTEYKLLTGDYD